MARFNTQVVRQQQIAARGMRSQQTSQSSSQNESSSRVSPYVSQLTSRRQEYDTRLGQIRTELQSTDPNLNTTRLFREEENLLNARAKVNDAIVGASANPDYGSKPSEQRLLLRANNPGIKRSEITQIQDPEAARVSANRENALRAQGVSESEIRAMSPAEQRTRLSPQTKTASVSVSLGAVGATQAAGTSPQLTRQVSRPASITDRNISYITSGRANYSTDFERKVVAQQQREERQAAGLERSKDIFRAVPGLRGDNYAQRFSREALALPATAAVTFVQTGQRGYLAAQSYRAQPAFTTAVLKQAGKETPKAAAQSFDPRQPSGLLNIALLGAGGFGLARGARINPIKAEKTVGVSRVSVTPKRTLITERIQLGGVLNRAANRLGTRTTTITPEGNVRATLKSDPFFSSKPARITDTFKIGDKNVVRKVNTGGKIREYEVKNGARGESLLVLDELDRPSVLKQDMFENLKKNIVKQESVRRESGTYLASIRNVQTKKFFTRGIRTAKGSQRGVFTYETATQTPETFGSGVVQARRVSVSELGPTSVVTRNRFGDVSTGETGVAVSRDFFQRDLSIGRGTSSEQRARYNRRPAVNFDLDRIEQTSVVARTPAPITTYAEATLVEFRGVRAQGGRRSLGRKGSYASGGELARFDPLAEFQKTIERPREVGKLDPARVGEVRIRLPRSAIRTSSRAGVGFVSTLRVSQDQRVVSDTTQVTPAVASSQRFSFDVDVRQNQRSRQVQETALKSSQSLGKTAQQSALVSQSPFRFSQATTTARPLGGAVAPFFLPFGSGRSGTRSANSKTSRKYAPSRGLFELTFSKSLGRFAKETPGGFTGLEFSRSYNPKKRSRKR